MAPGSSWAAIQWLGRGQPVTEALAGSLESCHCPGDCHPSVLGMSNSHAQHACCPAPSGASSQQQLGGDPAVMGMHRVGSQKGMETLDIARIWTLGLQPCCARDQATAFSPFYLKIGIIFGKSSPGLLTGLWSDTAFLHSVPTVVSLPQTKSLFMVDIPKDTPHS